MSLLTTACASNPALLSPDSLYPQALTTCADEPRVEPRADPTVPRSDEEKTQYAQGLREAWADCHGTVESWAERRARYVEQYERETYNPIQRAWRRATGQTGDR